MPVSRVVLISPYFSQKEAATGVRVSAGSTLQRWLLLGLGRPVPRPRQFHVSWPRCPTAGRTCASPSGSWTCSCGGRRRTTRRWRAGRRTCRTLGRRLIGSSQRRAHGSRARWCSWISSSTKTPFTLVLGRGSDPPRSSLRHGPRACTSSSQTRTAFPT